MNIYAALETSPLDIDGTVFNTKKITAYGKMKESSKSSILLLSDNDISIRSTCQIFCFSASGILREKIIDSTVGKFSFIDLTDKSVDKGIVFHEYLSLLEGLQTLILPYSEDIHAAINLSFGDFCIIIPNNISVNTEKIKNAVHQFLNPDEFEKVNIWENDKKLLETKKQILYRANTQNIYSLTSCKDVLDSLFRTNVDTIDKAWVLTMQASVMLYTFLEEVASNWLYSNGSPKKQTSSMEEEITNAADTFKRYYNTFLNQAANGSIHCDTVWSYLFLTSALMASLIGDCEDSAENKDEYNDFHGFIPTVAEDGETMDSFYCEQFGVLYSMGFLSLPYDMTFKFWEMIPSLIHEFSHYLSTPNRIDRNKEILNLVFCSVLKPLIEALSEYNTPETQLRVIDSLCEEITKRYDELSEWLIPGRNIHCELKDSMFFLSECMNIFEIIDFEDLFNHGLNAEGVREHIEDITPQIKENCIERWDNRSSSYLLTTTMAMREIRSDIAMCKFLEIDLEGYILLMANEPTWANYPWSYTADSVILRFGFMTRYLFAYPLICPKNCQEKCHCNCPLNKYKKRSALNSDWKNTVYEIINKLSNEHAELEEKLQNMKSYIDQYIVITLDAEFEEYENNTGFKDKVLSVFEKKLLPICEDGNDCIVQSWIRQFNDKMQDNRLIQNLRQGYRNYSSKTENESKILMDYKTRLVARDLYMFFPDIDK